MEEVVDVWERVSELEAAISCRCLMRLGG